MRPAILGPDQYRVMPWRNGRGRTTEIAIGPASADASDAFDWRVSVADVAEDGPFSLFPGCDRTIVPIEGAGMVLLHEGHGEQRLDELFRPARFSGDWRTSSTLIDGPVRDLNAMTRRSRARHEVTVSKGRARLNRTPLADVVVLCCLRGGAEGWAGTAPFRLAAGQTAVLSAGPGRDEGSFDAWGLGEGTVMAQIDIFLAKGGAHA